MAAEDLTSLEAVKAYLQITGTAQDALIESLITRASVMAMRFAEREFAPAQSNLTRTFRIVPGGDGTLVDLSPHDLRSASSVVLNPGASSPATLGAGDYVLEPFDAILGIYTDLRLSRYQVLASDFSARYGFAQLAITGDWGFEEVPADVEQACIVTVGTWLRRDVQAFSSTFQLETGILERPEALPSAVRGMLLPYRRWTIA